MFYSQSILTKKGALASIWLAAHWDRKLTKSQIVQTNIEHSVDEILSGKSGPLALRLSGQLLLGIVRIYWRKTKYLFDDINEAIQKIKTMFRPGMVNITTEQSLSMFTIMEDGNVDIPDLTNLTFEINLDAENLKKITLSNNGPSLLSNDLSLDMDDMEWQPWDAAIASADDNADTSDISFEVERKRRDSTASVEVARDAMPDTDFSPLKPLTGVESLLIDHHGDEFLEKSKSEITLEKDILSQNIIHESSQEFFGGFDDLQMEPLEMDLPIGNDGPLELETAFQPLSSVETAEDEKKESVSESSRKINEELEGINEGESRVLVKVPERPRNATARKRRTDSNDFESLQLSDSLISSQMKSAKDILKMPKYIVILPERKRIKLIASSNFFNRPLLLAAETASSNAFDSIFPTERPQFSRSKVAQVELQDNLGDSAAAENVVENNADIYPVTPFEDFSFGLDEMNAGNVFPDNNDNNSLDLSMNQSADQQSQDPKSESNRSFTSDLESSSKGLNFLVNDEDSSAKDNEASTPDLIENLNNATASFLRKELADIGSSEISFEEIGNKNDFDKRSASALFFQLLVLTSKSVTKVSQESMFGAIKIEMN